MKQKNYKIEEIFEKDLLFLIPFYIFSYEKQLPEYDSSKAKLEELKKEYGYIRTRLEELSRKKHIDEYTKCTILDMSKKVLENIAKKYKNVEEGVKNVMGGKVLEYEAKTIRNEGITQGISRGRIAAYVEMINARNITLAEAAERLKMSEEDLKAYCEAGQD